MSVPSQVRTYTRGQIVPFEEDMRHEFKGHRTITIENRTVMRPGMMGDTEVGEYSNTRQHWSKYLCGMLNSSGGTLYGGVQDNGQVSGFMMSEYQRDHVLIQLEDVFERFSPPVSPSQYELRFIPVVEEGEQYVADPVLADSALKGEEHVLRTTHRCWCDEEAAASHDFGRTMSPSLDM